MANDNTKTRYYQFYDQNGKKFDVNAQDYDADAQGFAQAYPNAKMRMVDKNGEQWDIPVANAQKAIKEGGYRMWSWEQVQKPVSKPTTTAEHNAERTREKVEQQTAHQLPLPEDFGQLDINANQLGNQSWEQPKEEQPKKENVVERQQRMMSGKATPQEQKATQSAMQQRMDEAEYQKETGKELKQPVLNTPFETPTLNRGEEGNYLIGNSTDQTRVGAHQQVAQEKEDMVNINRMLGEAYKERERLRKAEKQHFDTRGISSHEDRLEFERYEAAIRFLDRQVDALEAARDHGGFMSGTWDVLKDPSTYSFGTTDLQDATLMHNLKKKIDEAQANGTEPQLTEGEKALASNFMLNQQAQALNRDNEWYGIGQSFGNTLSFMKDFAVTGGGFASIAKKGMQIGGKFGTKTATKILGDYMQKNLGTKVLGKTMEYAGKAAGLVAGSEAAGFLLNNTAQAASSAADIINKHTGNLTLDKNGNITFEGGKGIIESIITSNVNRSGENASEMVGLAFDALPGIVNRLLQKTAVGKALKKFTSNKFWKGYEKGMNYLGVQSVLGEGMEEEYGMARNEILNYISGNTYDPNGESIFDWDNQLKTWKTVGLTSAILRVPSMIVSGAQQAEYYGNKYNLNKSDKNMRDALGDDERYESVKAMLDNADNKDIDKVVGGLMANAELLPDEKKAVFMYANDLVALRGFNIGSVLAAANGYVAQPRVSSYQIKADGKSFDELDKDGNVLAHHEYETPDEMKSALYEAQQTRFDNDLKSDIDVMKARPDEQYNALLQGYCTDNGIDPAMMEIALEKPSMERTPEEQQMVMPFAKVLHDAVYDNTILHEEQSANDGEEVADELAIDINDVQDNAEVNDITAAWNAAQQERQQWASRNEDLASEVEYMEKQGLSPQEILASLDTFTDDERQMITNYYNQKARYEGFLNRMAEKIDEQAANERERSTFKGTVNGEQDPNNVLTIVDDAGNRYTLVSGNITTDKDGNVTDSDSGLIIGIDAEGNFVSLSDKRIALSSERIPLNDFEESERIRLQQQITQAVDPEGILTQPQPIEEKTVEPTDAEASTENGTGANETPVGETATTPEVETTNAPTIESVTDADGVKRYELGIPVDDAIADMQADGLDVNEEADLAISEAQTALNKIKQPKTRAERVKNAEKIQELQGIIDYYNNVKARYAEITAPVEQPQQVVEQPAVEPVVQTTTPSQPSTPTVEDLKQQRIAELKEKFGELFDDDFTKANDVYELASMWVGRKRNLAWDDVNGKRGLQKELGWQRKIGGDTKYIETLLAKNGEGIGVDEFVHMVWESPENDVNGEKRYSTEEIKEALLDLLKSAQSKSDVVDYAVNTRAAQAEAAMQAQQEMEAEQAAQAEQQPTEEQAPYNTGGLPFGMPEEETTNNVNENNNEEDNNVSLQIENTNDNEQGEMGSQNQEGDGSNGVSATASDVLRGCSVAAGEAGQGSRSKQRLLAQLEESAKSAGYWLDEPVNEISDLKFSVGGENEVYRSEDGTIAYKLNNFAFLRDDATNFEDFLNRLDSHNELFPDVALQVVGFAKNSKGEVSVILQQPWVEAEREATEEEIDAALEDLDFYTDMSGNWTDGRYVIADVKPNNVLVDKQGNLRFIDAVTYDDTLPGQMMKAKKPETTSEKVEKPTDEYLQPRDADEEKIVADVINKLQQEIQAAIEEQDKARSALRKAQEKESERGTDMFANDDAFNQEGQLFDNSDMPADQTIEGVERRTTAEREKLQEATNKLNQLQSEQERNSRVRGALESHRKQTSIGFEDGKTDNIGSKKPENTTTWQYNFYYDKETGRVRITRDDVSGPIPIGDGRWHLDAKSLDEMRAILENPANNLGDVYKDVEASLHNAEVGERLRNESNPNKAIEQAATEFSQEQKKESYGADNKLVSQDRYEELKKRMIRKITGQLNAGFDPEILQIGTEMAMFHIEAGARKFADYATRMINDLGDAIRPYLKSFYEAARRMPGMEELSKEMDSTEAVDNFDVLSYDKQIDNSVNDNKQENNEPEKVVSSQKEEELQGDSAEFVEREKKIAHLSEWIAEQLDSVVFKGVAPLTMQNIKSYAKGYGLEDISLTDLQEIVEAEIVKMAREISSAENLNDEQKFEFIVRLYEKQPTLSARDNDRINLQQYSTPAPMAYLMGLFTNHDKKAKKALEPSAGNGMLTINLPKEIMHVNDIDEMRLSNLQKQGFGEVTSQDGTQSFGEKKYDIIVTNPPFGSVTPQEWGLFEISALEHQMALNALASMKDDGRAAIIIGGNTEYKQNGAVQGKDRQFLNYLYQAYNVVDVINIDGKSLYSKQGTGYNVRMILIDGRKPKYDASVYAPVRDKARAEQVKSYDELLKRVQDDILSDTNKSASVHDTESGESRRVDDTGNAGNTTQEGVRNVQPERSEGQPAVRSTNGRGIQRGNNTTKQGADQSGSTNVGGGLFDVESRTEVNEPSRGEVESTGEQQPELGRNDVERPVTEPSEPSRSGRSARVDNPHRVLGAEKVPYIQQSTNPYSLQSQMPAEQAEVTKKALEELGDVDQFLVNELGYSSIEDLHHGSQSPDKHGGLAAEQIDSVAMAIHQMNQGSAFIIGDQTGIGKGRQAAALIRYGVKKGGFPVFVTVKKALFSDMYRDLCDIGSPKLRPFIWSADDAQHSGNVTDKDGNVVFEMPSAKEQKRVVDYINKYGKLPKEYDYVLTTYDSFKSGTMDYEDGKKSPRKFPKGKSAGAVHVNGQAKRDALERLAENSYVIMDESHNAGGEGSNISNYLQYITTKAKGVTFLSATFAKRPGNMPIYSLKTAISKAGVSVGELIDAVKRGGATFQEIMSKALTEAGQMIRRERDMTGVTIDWRGIEDEEVIQKQREQYDKIIGLFNDIIDFQRTYIDPIIDQLNDDAAEVQGEVDHTPGTRDMGINNTPFASRTYNMVQQVLLSLKAEEAAKRAIEHLKLGRKPVITVANTNEGAADAVAATDGESMEMPDLGVNLKKGLQGTLRIQKKDASNNTTQSMIPFERLPEEAQKRYAEIMQAIENSSSGLSLSPIDVIKNELKKAGYSVGELTGRQAEFIYNEDGTVKRARRHDTDKKKIAADFNNGKLDALILNKSAGTGISLHASVKFADQRQRIMIVAQAQGDVNDEVQIRGRIDRTGQVLRGMYEYVVSQIPSEQRLLMMLKAKLRSLDANTTSSQKSKFNEMQVQDIMNKYGDQIVVQYLAENPDTYAKLADPLKWGDSVYDTPVDTLIANASRPQGDGATASKILGRMALLTVKEQEKMLDEVGELYQTEIDRLNEMGENDLEITEMPLRAKTLSKQVWEQGVDPEGNNPFADNTYVEKVNMDVLRKPMKGSEVKASQERLLGGKTWEEYKQATLVKVDEWAEQKKADTTATFTERATKKAEAEKEKYIKAAKKAQEKNGMTDEEIERNGGYQYDTFYKQEMDKLNDALAAIESQKQVFVDALEMFSTDGVYALPSNIYDLASMTFEPGFGKLIDIKISDNMSVNASTITFATLDGRRKITIPINGKVKQQKGEKAQIFPTITSLTAQTKSNWFGANVANTMKVLEQSLDNWDKLTSTAARKDGYIITGNLLKALVSTREQGVGGKLIAYTTDTGEVRQGILMPDNFEPKGLTSKTPISSKKDELKYPRDKVESADGEVVVRVTNAYDWSEHAYNKLELIVPKSKKRGEKYFNDETLLSLIVGQFEGGSKLTGEFPRRNLDAVMKRLDELGVTVAEEHKEDNNSQNTLRSREIITNSRYNAVPLKYKELKSYEDKEGNYHRGLEEELAALEADLSGRRTGVAGDGERSENKQVVPATVQNAMRRRAAAIRAEIARRNQLREEYRKKYGIDAKGNISLEGLEKLFDDLNKDKNTKALFDKVCEVAKNLGIDIRFTDRLDGITGGITEGQYNVIFYNWDALMRERANQDKAGTILHELIHGISEHILMRYENPSLGELTEEQKKVAKELTDIFNVVDAAMKDREGEKPYGLTNAHEMLAELSKPEFRELLDTIPYNENLTVWQKIKKWVKNMLKVFGVKGNTALDSLNKTLDHFLDTYSEEGIAEYNKRRNDAEKEFNKAHPDKNFVDFLEENTLDFVGPLEIVTDAEEVARLNNEPVEKGYRTVVQNEDGTFGSPMANRLSGKKGQQSKPTSSYKMGEWERSEENPQLANDKGKITLVKPNGLGTVGNVDYNPYIHIRENKLNKQFKNAWERPDLVYIEVDYPQSETTSGYRAEKAAKTVGRHKWPGGDLILSRWDKPVRIVPWEEVADDWVKEFKDRGVEFDIVSPHLLPILAERGVKILPPHKGMGEACKKAYEDFKKKQAITDPMKAINESARQFRRERITDPMEAIIKSAKEFRRRQVITSPSSPLVYSAKEVYNERLNTVDYVFTEAYQDSMVALKTAQNAIAKDKEIPDSQNAYMAENLSHGKNKNEQDAFNHEYRDPIINLLNEILDETGLNWGDMDRYVYTKSGLERNREFFVRDWLEAQRKAGVPQSDLDDIHDEWQAVKDRAYLDLTFGDITNAEYLDILTDFIRNNMDDSYEPAEHDYSGFRAMFGDEDGVYDEGEVIAELQDTEDKIGSDNVIYLWYLINDATRYGLERYREAGMRSDEQIDEIESMFHFYVPMRGFKDNTGEDMYQYFTSKSTSKSYVGGLLKHAKGRGSEANYPISTIFSMTYKAIADCNQNLVCQKFYRLCQANPNDLVVLSDSWAKLDETTGLWEEAYPEIPEDASEEEVRAIVKTFEEDMKALAAIDKAKKLRGKARFDYKPTDRKKKSEHIVEVRVNGQKKLMTIVGNPRMAQALNGQLRFESGKNVFSKWNAKIKNMMASMFTSYSPTFALRNMMRDWTHFRTMLGVREGYGYAAQANKYYRQSLFKMVGLFKKYREGHLDMSNEMERDFKDFMDNGGITGFVQMQKIDDIQKEMESLYKQQKEGKPIKFNNKLWDYTLGAIEALNEGIENNARFATFRASRHYAGRTKARAAYDAKEITVNFNRKGAGAKTAGYKSESKLTQDAAKAFGVTAQILGEGRIFFNATVQAIATTFKCFRNPDGSLNKQYIAKWAAKYAAPPFMFGLALPFVNKMLAAALGGDGDDDPYANLPEWTRRKNLCFYIGRGNFITIPIGQELAAFLALGDIAAGMTYSPELKPVDKNLTLEMVDVLNTFSPVDINTKITKGGVLEDPLSEAAGRTFSVLAPIVAIEQNIGWTGRPIYREDRYDADKYNPEYQMTYNNVNPVLIGASKWLNDISGGDEVRRGKIQINPAQVQYMWEQYTGGPGKVFSNTISLGKDFKDFIKGEDTDFNIRKVEGLKAFVQQSDERTQYYRTLAKYRKYKDDAAELYNTVREYEKGAEENPDYWMKLEGIAKGKDFVRMQMVREADKELQKLYKEANKAEGKERKQLLNLYNQGVKEVVDELDAIEDYEQENGRVGQ